MDQQEQRCDDNKKIEKEKTNHVKSTNPFLPYPDVVDTVSSPEMTVQEEDCKDNTKDTKQVTGDDTMEFLSKIIQQESSRNEDKIEEKLKGEKEEDSFKARFQYLIEENKKLKKLLANEEDEKKKIISINHDWEEKYRLLKEENDVLNKEMKVLNDSASELNETLTEKEKKVKDLTKQTDFLMKTLEETYDRKPGNDDENFYTDVDDMSFAADSVTQRTQDDKKFDKNGTVEMVLTDAKRERDAILKREQDAIMVAKELEAKNYQMHVLLVKEIKRKQDLQLEFDRITILLERELQTKNMAMASGSDALNNNIDLQNQMALLQQQLVAYKEDFSMEKNEKLKLANENENLKREHMSLKESNELLFRQLRIYEEDFHRERQKRINTMKRYSNSTSANGRMVSPPSPSVHSYHGSSSHSSVIGAPAGIDDQQRYKEYCSLIVEKEQLSDRISELESQGVLRYGGRPNVMTGPNSQDYQQSRQFPPLQLPTPPGATAAIPNSPDSWHMGDYYVSSIPPSDAGSSYRGSPSYASRLEYQSEYDIAR